MDREERKADDATNNFKFKCINEMKETIEDEVRELCREWYIEAKYFLRQAFSIVSRVFYQKIKADTFRYLAQFETGKNVLKVIGETEKRYLEAVKEAQSMETTHPLRLALMLNYAIFKYEIE